MGFMLHYTDVHFLTDGIMSGNPSKKIRLDLHKKNDGSIGNEDLWGQDDLTAEEFDMLEIQATQSCNQSINYGNNHALHNVQNNIMEVEDLKHLQYELEGRVKLLSHSLEKTTKELSEERLNREQLINEKMKEFNKREINLQKEVEKMQSILEFKDQEMKSIHSKLQMMKSQLQVRKSTSTEASMNISFEDFLKSSKFGSSEHFSKPNVPKKFQRKHKLITDTPKGETKSIDILSSILFTRLSLPSFLSCEYAPNSAELEQDFSKKIGATVSVMKLKNEQECYELLEYYNCFLRNHVAMLKTIASRSNTTSCNENSPISSKKREAGYSHTVISYLRDIGYIFSCSKSCPSIKEECGSEDYSEHFDIQKVKQSSLWDSHNEGVMNSSISILSQTLQLLSELANPKTYPSGYSKNEEIEFSLSVLLAICSSNPEKFLDLIGELPITSLQIPLQNVRTICITMKLLIVLCSCKNFITFLTHRKDDCIFCLISNYLINIVPHYPENFAISIILVEDFLSLVFSITHFLEPLLETSECISEVIQGIILCVWRYYQLRERINLSAEVIKKGFLLLHFMSYYIPNFKERRNPVENEYISLISGILALSKENNELREFYDLIHNLWDFQTDTTEFDSDDLSEETQNSTDDIAG